MNHAKLLLGALLALSSVTPARATIMYGALSNFDCINDTGTTAHGFEIELDGVSPSDVSYTFGAPYNRYGDPAITTDGTNTYIRYASSYANGQWAVGTDSGTMADTGGHSLYFSQYGGSPNYPNVPGDHFGIGLNVNPINTIYHWLLDDGTGHLVRAGTQVKLPAPVLTVTPPVNPGGPAAIQAAVQAPAALNGQEFGDAIWVKVYTTVVQNPEPVKLEDLVIGNPHVAPETETEIEWRLLQAGSAGNGEKLDTVEAAGPNESITRRYEFYQYAGLYDVETHEALKDKYDPSLIGGYLGTQNVGLNLGADVNAVPEPSAVVMTGLGLAGIATMALRRRKNALASR